MVDWITSYESIQCEPLYVRTTQQICHSLPSNRPPRIITPRVGRRSGRRSRSGQSGDSGDSGWSDGIRAAIAASSRGFVNLKADGTGAIFSCSACRVAGMRTKRDVLRHVFGHEKRHKEECEYKTGVGVCSCLDHESICLPHIGLCWGRTDPV